MNNVITPAFILAAVIILDASALNSTEHPGSKLWKRGYQLRIQLKGWKFTELK